MDRLPEADRAIEDFERWAVERFEQGAAGAERLGPGDVSTWDRERAGIVARLVARDQTERDWADALASDAGALAPADVDTYARNTFERTLANLSKRGVLVSEVGGRHHVTGIDPTSSTHLSATTDPDDHLPVSVSGWTCDLCGRSVNGQTDFDGITRPGDSVRHC